VRIATFNVNGVNGRLPRLLEWLAETRPDIACLQEIKTSDPKFPEAPLQRAGYRAIWHGQRSHHGVAILARDTVPLERRRGLPGADTDVQARYLEAEVDGLRIGSVYLPNGNPVGSPNFDYKLRWFERFIAYAASLCARPEPVVLAGDLNVIPTDFDIYNPWAWRFDAVMQPESRAAFGRLIDQGWTDAVRSLHPKERMYSFWVNAGAFQRGAGFRLDFLLLNRIAALALVAAGVDAAHRGREKPSDHAPVWIELAPAPVAGTHERHPRQRRFAPE
jgi:exodeoxyribonuclease-3